jgi:hypothetical protein
MSTSTIIITVEDGIIQSVEGIPADCRIIIRSIDTHDPNEPVMEYDWAE